MTQDCRVFLESKQEFEVGVKAVTLGSSGVLCLPKHGKRQWAVHIRSSTSSFRHILMSRRTFQTISLSDHLLWELT